MGHLKNKVALITGGSRGIGAAIARRFAKEGADVVITYVDGAARAQQVVADVKAAGVRGLAIRADAVDAAAVQAAIAQTRRDFDRLDILVNNAGIYTTAPLTETSDEAFDRMVAVNVRAPFVAAREAARLMGQGGRIINIGSLLGESVPFPGLTAYSMSKFALAGMTRAWARDLGPRGITVNIIQPGPVDTELNPANGPSSEAQKGFTVLGRFGTAEEVAAAAAYLASAEAAFVTGATINVTGGLGV
ncbi:MAG: SDR family oxidoreductase [Proteobacteria bacterium]|nr:SDR family oxidoreductase [Pseudomonadota bacterium]